MLLQSYYADEDTLQLYEDSDYAHSFCTSIGCDCVPRFRFLRAVNSTRVIRTRYFLRCCEGNIYSRVNTLRARARDVPIPQSWALTCPHLNATNAITGLSYH